MKHVLAFLRGRYLQNAYHLCDNIRFFGVNNLYFFDFDSSLFFSSLAFCFIPRDFNKINRAIFFW